MAYSAFEITSEDRVKLARVFPPKFSDFIGHHCTFKFPANPDDPNDLPMDSDVLCVVGYASDDSLECLVVEVNGSVRRPKGGTYHITWSLDRNAGRKPVDSNEVLRGGFTSIRPINIATAPRFFK